MLKVAMTPDGFFRVEFFLESVKVCVVEAKDLTVVLTEIEQKCRMMRGLFVGKVFTSGTSQ